MAGEKRSDSGGPTRKHGKPPAPVLVVELDPEPQGVPPVQPSPPPYAEGPDYGDYYEYDDGYEDGYQAGYEQAQGEWQPPYAAPSHQPAQYQWDPAQEQERALPPPVDEQPVPVWPQQPSWVFTPTGAVLAFFFGPCLVQIPLQFVFFVYLVLADVGWSLSQGQFLGIALTSAAASVFFYVLYFRAYLRRQPWVPLWDVSGWLITREVQGMRWVMARRPIGRLGWIPAEQWEWLPRQEWERREAQRAAGAAASLFIALGLLYLTTRSWGRR